MLAAPAEKSQLFSTSVVHIVHFGSSSWQVATFQYKCSTQNTFCQLQGRLQGSWLDSAWRLMSWVLVGHRFGHWFGALQIYDSAVLVCDNNLNLICVFMTAGGSGFFLLPSVSVYNGFGLRNKLRDGPLPNDKARGCFFQPM